MFRRPAELLMKWPHACMPTRIVIQERERIQNLKPPPGENPRLHTMCPRDNRNSLAADTIVERRSSHCSISGLLVSGLPNDHH